MSGGETRDGDEAAGAPCLGSGRSWPAHVASGRVLLVVADDRIRGLMRRLLEVRGYEVVPVSGEVLPSDVDADIAIVDLADQSELSPPLAEALAATPVLATTSLPEHLLAGRVGLRDPSAWLSKPVSPVVLLWQVERLLTRPTG